LYIFGWAIDAPEIRRRQPATPMRLDGIADQDFTVS